MGNVCALLYRVKRPFRRVRGSCGRSQACCSRYCTLHNQAATIIEREKLASPDLCTC